ncbi:MAG: DNA alkylation repair protein [bacterium]
MTLEKALKELEGCGSPQNRKVYARHGVGRNMYGVSFANLNVLKRKIRVDHDLALALWQTGNHDARVLATMIADEKQISWELLELWAQDLDNYIIADSFAGLAARMAEARAAIERWTASDHEWISRAGWQLLAILAMRAPDLTDDYFDPWLNLIATSIHSRKNRVKDAMNSALIAIGIRNGTLRQRALAVAGRIGKVEVDHGKTDRQTPDAIEYIAMTWERKKTQEKNSG